MDVEGWEWMYGIWRGIRGEGGTSEARGGRGETEELNLEPRTASTRERLVARPFFGDRWESFASVPRSEGCPRSTHGFEQDFGTHEPNETFDFQEPSRLSSLSFVSRNHTKESTYVRQETLLSR